MTGLLRVRRGRCTGGGYQAGTGKKFASIVGLICTHN
jgi:hypothetical protein